MSRAFDKSLGNLRVFYGSLQFFFSVWGMNKYCTVAVCRNESRKRPDLDYCCFPVKSDDRKKWEVLCKRADKRFKRLIDPRICSLHFKETDTAISISGSKNIPSGCYPTIFDPTKAKNTTRARSKRVDNRKRRYAEQPKAIKGKAPSLIRTNSVEKRTQDQNLKLRAKPIEDIHKL